MKKVLATILSIVMVFTILPVAVVNVSAYQLTKGKCGNSVNYSFNKSKGKLIIKGKGKMYNYDLCSTSFFSYYSYHHSDLKTVVIKNGVKNIGDCAFYDCKSLKKVKIPKSVKKINEYAFFNCKKLKSVTIPKNVKKIGREAFGYYMLSSGDKIKKVKGFTIKGKKGSAAHKYAKKNGFKFKKI